MIEAANALRSKQFEDRFEIIPRPRPADPGVTEWRIRCLDCPGKVSQVVSSKPSSALISRILCVIAQLYNLGPGETLDNFAIHFRNKQHRANVDARLGRRPPLPPTSAPTGRGPTNLSPGISQATASKPSP